MTDRVKHTKIGPNMADIELQVLSIRTADFAYIPAFQGLSCNSLF